METYMGIEYALINGQRYTRGGRTIAWRAEFRNAEREATVGGIGYTKAQARRAMRTLIREFAVGPK